MVVKLYLSTSIVLLDCIIHSLHCIVEAEDVALNWTLSAIALPYTRKSQSAGYCEITQKIWLFGGFNHNSISSYHINTGEVTIYEDLLYTFRSSTSYNVKNGIIYFNPYKSHYISRFLTENASFDWDYIKHPSMYLYFTVTTSLNSDILYVLGGNQTTDFYLYDLNSHQWHQGHNGITTQHAISYAPFVTEHRLITVSRSSLEYVDISGSIQDIILRDWILHQMDDLTEHNSGIAIDNEIWFIGGYGPTGYCCAKSGVQIIDAETFDISYGNTPITFSGAGLAYNPDDDIIYVVSGWSDNVGMLDRIYMINEYNASLDPFDVDDTEDGYDTDSDDDNEESMSEMSVVEIFCIVLGILLCFAIIIIVVMACSKDIDTGIIYEGHNTSEMFKSFNSMEKENDSGIGECEICMEHKKQYAFVKCGHLVCGECASKLWKANAKICPFCKQNISSIIKLYGLNAETQ